MQELVLVRHGETDGEAPWAFHGSSDLVLSALGESQMRRVANALCDESFDLVLASSLRCAQRSAVIVTEGRDSDVQVEERFREVDFGEWEGCSIDEIQQSHARDYEGWRAGELDFSFPGGESLADFRARVQEGTRALIERSEERVLAVLPEGVIQGIVAVLLEVPAAYNGRGPIEHGSVHRLEIYRGRWRIKSVNEVHHLGEHRARTSRS